MDQIVEVVMPGCPSCNSSARQTMCAFWVYQGTAWALMRLADPGAESKSNGDSYGLVVQPETTGSYRQCVEPIPAVWRGQCKHTSVAAAIR